MTPGVHRLFGVLALATVGVALAWGFTIVGTPDARRVQKLDERRLADLQAIHREIQALVIDPQRHTVMKQPLPQTLEEVARLARGQKLTLTDPATGASYGYEVSGEATYRLCATFALSRAATEGVFWNHPAGPHCYAIDARDPP